jgi:hypothetical protein
MLRNERVGDFLRQIVDIMRDEVGHLTIFGVSPGMVNAIEFGCISREELHVHLVPRDIPQQTGGFFVPTEAIPDQPQRPLAMATQLLDKGKDSVSGAVPENHREIESHTLLPRRHRDGPCHREARMTVPTGMARGLPLGGPGAAPGGGGAPRLSMPRHGIAPAPAGTGRGLDVAGHVTDAPAGLQEGDGDAAADFELERGPCGLMRPLAAG